MHEYLTSPMNGEMDRADTLAELATEIAFRAKVRRRRKIGLWLARRPKWYRRTDLGRLDHS